MGYGYQERDYEIIDYELFQLDGIDHPVRGPRPKTLESREYFVCVGAAQTFGCYAEKPFPLLLQERLSLPALNLGVAGAGPLFFLRYPDYLRYVNNARFAILQVMSGRSENNSLFDSGGREWLTRRTDGKEAGASPLYRELLESGDDDLIESVVEETRQNWISNSTMLLRAIQVPKVLLWFSRRRPHYEPDRRNVYAFFGEFPQLVTDEWLEPIVPFADYYVECVTERGTPQRLINRFTGKPTSIQMRADLGGRQKKYNDYYPSPQMHTDAANVLEPVCRGLLGLGKALSHLDS